MLFVTQEPGANRAVVKHMLMFIQEHKRQSVHKGVFQQRRGIRNISEERQHRQKEDYLDKGSLTKHS